MRLILGDWKILNRKLWWRRKERSKNQLKDLRVSQENDFWKEDRGLQAVNKDTERTVRRSRTFKTLRRRVRKWEGEKLSILHQEKWRSKISSKNRLSSPKREDYLMRILLMRNRFKKSLWEDRLKKEKSQS